MIKSGDAPNADWSRFMAYQRQFGTDFFGLAGAQLREFFDRERAVLGGQGKPLDEIQWITARYGNVPDFRDARIPTYLSGPMTPALLDEWWKAINTTDWRSASLSTLKIMWEGASTLLPGKKLVPWKTVESFLSSRFELPPERSDTTDVGVQNAGADRRPIKFLRTLFRKPNSTAAK